MELTIREKNCHNISGNQSFGSLEKIERLLIKNEMKLIYRS